MQTNIAYTATNVEEIATLLCRRLRLEHCDRLFATARSDFDALYVAWHRESEVIAVSSRTGDYVGLPSYRKIVALGPAAVPYIAEKLSGDSGGHFMLAEAVVEICGWNRSEVADASEQQVSSRVLRRLATGKTCGA